MIFLVYILTNGCGSLLLCRGSWGLGNAPFLVAVVVQCCTVVDGVLNIQIITYIEIKYNSGRKTNYFETTKK